MAKGWKFEDNSAKIKAMLESASEEAMEAAGLMIESQAKSLAPVGDSGELRDKINHTVSRENGVVVGKVGSPTDYSIYVEYGTGEMAENGAGRKGGWVYKAPNGKWYYTRGQKPKPFLRPAFRRNKKNIQDIVGKHYKAKF
ncbi:HK97-gp10 family putative phage morphogenesis protein [Aerococcus urinaeequi]|uniref:HK97-gp10 family putative phage morphogenesis protein n=1 Tax=Aerococcus urinaeequi TaxID=51665 RepID=UPI000845DC90|nr:HK97-gp10 family putative phage morphogenesis protein [Aerococcus urinaeequi]